MYPVGAVFYTRQEIQTVFHTFKSQVRMEVTGYKKGMYYLKDSHGNRLTMVHPIQMEELFEPAKN